MPSRRPKSVAEERPHLARALNSFDATLIVMGGIIGTGIFVNPSVVAGRAQTTPLILTAWGRRRRDRAVRRIRFCGTGGAQAVSRRSAGHRLRRRRLGPFQHHQLLRRARGRLDAESFHGAQDRRHLGAHRGGSFRRAAGRSRNLAQHAGGRARIVCHDGNRADPRAVRLRRLADRELHERRTQGPGAHALARLGDRGPWRHRALYGGDDRVPSRARSGQTRRFLRARHRHHAPRGPGLGVDHQRSASASRRSVF